MIILSKSEKLWNYPCAPPTNTLTHAKRILLGDEKIASLHTAAKLQLLVKKLKLWIISNQEQKLQFKVWVNSIKIEFSDTKNEFCYSVRRLQDLVGGKEATTLWENSTKNREDGDNKIDQNHVKNFFGVCL